MTRGIGIGKLVQVVPEYLTPAEVAGILKLSTDTIIRKFEGYPGVLSLGSEEKRFKRRYWTLRIPKTALERFIVENSAGRGNDRNCRVSRTVH